MTSTISLALSPATLDTSLHALNCSTLSLGDLLDCYRTLLPRRLVDRKEGERGQPKISRRQAVSPDTLIGRFEDGRRSPIDSPMPAKCWQGLKFKAIRCLIEMLLLAYNFRFCSISPNCAERPRLLTQMMACAHDNLVPLAGASQCHTTRLQRLSNPWFSVHLSPFYPFQAVAAH